MSGPGARPDWREAVQATADGRCRILLHAQPGAAAERFPDGYDPWRGRLGVRVRTPAREGRANAAIVAAVARALGLPEAAVALEAGASASRKAVVAALPHEEALRRLAPLLEA
jgi:uncharacterized protein